MAARLCRNIRGPIGLVPRSAIDQRSHDLFGEEWIAVGALREKTFQAFQTGVGPQQYVKKFPEVLAYERIDAQLAIVRAISPLIVILRTITDDEQQTGVARLNHQLVEQSNSKCIVPVEIFKNRDDRLRAALIRIWLPPALG